MIAGANLYIPTTRRKIPVSEIETCVVCFRLSVSEECYGGQRISARHLRVSYFMVWSRLQN